LKEYTKVRFENWCSDQNSPSGFPSINTRRLSSSSTNQSSYQFRTDAENWAAAAVCSRRPPSHRLTRTPFQGSQSLVHAKNSSVLNPRDLAALGGQELEMRLRSCLEGLTVNSSVADSFCGRHVTRKALHVAPTPLAQHPHTSAAEDKIDQIQRATISRN